MIVVNVTDVLRVLGDEAPAGNGAPELTVGDFQANAATGTYFLNPQFINDNNLENQAIGLEDEYAEVDLGSTFKAKQYRYYGSVEDSNTAKIQHYDVAWHDWAVLPIHNTIDWSDWINIGEQEMSKIRVCNDMGVKYIKEIEFKF